MTIAQVIDLDMPARPSAPARRRRAFGDYSDLAGALDSLKAERDWTFEGAIERAPIVVLVAPEKKGKSWAAMSATVATVTGGAWLGAFQVRKPGDVVFLDGENGEAEFARRFARVARAAGHDPREIIGRVRHVHASIGITLETDNEELAQIALDIEEDPPALIIIDPWRNLLAGDENSVKDTITAFRAVEALRLRANAPVIIAHHLNKSGISSGSRALMTRADLIIEGTDEEEPLYRTRGRSLRTSDAIAAPFVLKVSHENDDDDTRGVTVVGLRFESENRARTQLTGTARKILDVIRSAAKPMTAAAVGRACGITNGSVRTRLLEELRASGKVDRTRAGWTIATSEFFRDLENSK